MLYYVFLFCFISVSAVLAVDGEFLPWAWPYDSRRGCLRLLVVASEAAEGVPAGVAGGGAVVGVDAVEEFGVIVGAVATSGAVLLEQAAVVVVVLHSDVVAGFNRQVKVVEASVAQQQHLAREVESKGIHIAIVVDGEMHVYIGVAHVGILHIGEKLLVEMEVKGVCAFGEALERQ